MARKPKRGLDYFPLDVDFQGDPKVRKLIYRFGSDAVSVFVMFLNELYKNGYYFEGDLETLSESIAYEIGKSGEEGATCVRRILEAMLSLGMIDKGTLSLYGVITSKGVQKQFLLSTSRRKKSERKYWLLSEDEEQRMGEFLEERKLKQNEDNGATEVDLCMQKSSSSDIPDSKNEVEGGFMSTEVRKVKVKVKDKEKEDKNDRYDIGNVGFELDYFTKCLISDHLIDVYDLNLHNLNDFFLELKDGFDYELIERCFRYTRDYVRRHKGDIANVYAFFKTAMNDNVLKMDGYEERMEKYFREWDEYLKSTRSEEKKDMDLEGEVENI